jgi:transcriptional regulator with XRE-family HTH domain
MLLQDKLSSSPELMKMFQRERLESELTELICQTMEEEKINRAELAARLGKSKPYVTKILRDGNNLSVKSISDIFFSLNRSIRLLARPLSMWTPELLVMEIGSVADMETSSPADYSLQIEPLEQATFELDHGPDTRPPQPTSPREVA